MSDEQTTQSPATPTQEQAGLQVAIFQLQGAKDVLESVDEHVGDLLKGVRGKIKEASQKLQELSKAPE